MTPELDADLADVEDVTEQRDAVVAAVRDHAGRIAYGLAKLQGGDYGQREFTTPGGTWTVKYEGGDLQYLRFDPRSGSDVYVVSTKQPPDPEELVTALRDYDAFVAAYNDRVASLDGVLDDVATEFPTIESTDTVVAERDRIVSRVREVCDTMAGELHRYEGTDYGTFAARVDGTRWELKWEAAAASYLRVGGSGGTYVLSQYEPPSAADLREHVPGFSGFVEAYNDHVRDLELDLREVSL
jgi:hypothetical protein